MKKRILCFTLFLFFALVSVSPSFANITKENDRLKRIQGDLKEKQNQIEATKKQQGAVSQNLEQVLAKKAILISEIKSNEKQIAETKAEIEKIKKELEVARAEIKAQQKEFSERLRVMYMQEGTESNLSLLLTSKSIEDFLMNASYMKNIVDLDKETLKSLNDKREKIEKLESVEKSNLEKLQSFTKKLEADKKELAAVEVTLEKRKAELESLRANQEKAYNALRSEEEATKANIAKYKKQAEEARKKRGMTPKANIVASKGFVWPAPGVSYISSPFGWRSDPISGARRFHNGIDIAGPAGSPLVSVKNGVVIASGYRGGSGNYVLIDHGDGTQSYYCHGLSRVVQIGDEVKAGQLIMYMGSTGYSTGPHVHFVIYVNGQEVNPLQFY